MTGGDCCAEAGERMGLWTIAEYVKEARRLRIGITFSKYA